MADDVKLANPAVLGLTCFGMTTVLLNLHNAGLFKQDVPILAMGIFLGGIAQIIAGIMEYKKGNTFGTTAFIAYGSFWLTLVFIILLKPGLVAWQVGEKALLVLEPSNKGFAWYLALWGLFTIFMFVGTLKVNRVLQFVFVTLIILYGLLAVHFAWFSYPGKSGAVLKVGGSHRHHLRLLRPSTWPRPSCGTRCTARSSPPSGPWARRRPTRPPRTSEEVRGEG